jgi:hypothetical protein
MPSAAVTAGGIGRVHPEREVRSNALNAESTDVQAAEHTSTSEPWESWGCATRYLIVRIAQAAPSALLVWQAYAHH